MIKSVKKTKRYTTLKLFLTTTLCLIIFLIGIAGLWVTYYSISEGIIDKNILVGRSGIYERVEGNWAVIVGLFQSVAGVLIFLASLGVIAYLFATYDSKK